MLNRRRHLVVPCAVLAAALSVCTADVAASEHRVRCAKETISFVSSRDDPTGNPLLTAEIYLMDPDGTNPRRLTENTDGDGFPALSPDGKRIVFDSNRNRAVGEPLNTSDLFLMKNDGSQQRFLTRGSSATWSPDSKFIAYHASASGTLPPIRPDPGAPAADSDIFVARAGPHEARPINITNSPDDIEEDADWSPDGQTIVYTRHAASDQPPNFNYTSKEILVLNADGTGVPLQLTFNDEEERAPAWSPDGKRIAYNCRKGPPITPGSPVRRHFRICVMNTDGTDQTQLTFGLDPVSDLTLAWSPDGQKIVFHRPVAGQGLQLWVMNADGTGEAQLTTPPGMNGFPKWGNIKTHCAEDDEDN